MKKLSPKEVYVLYGLALQTDYETKVSYVNQTTLLDKLNSGGDTESLRHLQRKLSELAESGLIEKNTQTHLNKDNQSMRFNTYKLDNVMSGDNYILVRDTLEKEPIRNEAKGFLIMLKMLCYNFENHTNYTSEEMASLVGLSVSQVNRYIKELKDLGYITKRKKNKVTTTTIIRDNDFFINGKQSELVKIKKLYPECLTDEDLLNGKIL